MREQKGQTLLEILIAFGVSIMVLAAIVIVVATALSNALYSKNQNLATSYAKEGMSTVRQIRDSSWINFSQYTTNTTYCIAQNSTVLTNPAPALNCGQNVGIFSREVKFEHDSQSCCSNNDPACTGGVKGSKATIKVFWSDSKCPAGNSFCHKVELISCLSNIDQKQAP